MEVFDVNNENNLCLWDYEMHRSDGTCWSYTSQLFAVRDQPFYFVVDFPENNGSVIFFLISRTYLCVVIKQIFNINGS